MIAKDGIRFHQEGNNRLISFDLPACKAVTGKCRFTLSCFQIQRDPYALVPQLCAEYNQLE